MSHNGVKPDHGESYVPGSESAPEYMAPEPLDHFKRGYQERSNLRHREIDSYEDDNDAPPQCLVRPELKPHPSRNGANEMSTSSLPQTAHLSQPPPPIETRQNPTTIQFKSEPRSSFRGSYAFDAVRVVDVLCRPGCDLEQALDRVKNDFAASFQSGKALTAILSNLARRRKMGIALYVWQWMDSRGIEKNVFHYNSLISVCEKVKDNQRALKLLEEMERKSIPKNEVTFSSAISACEKAGQWRVALELLDRMKRDGVGRTAIAFNAAISACEKGLVPHKALELFEQMKSEGVVPTVVTYSALISAAEKGQQWKLALEVLDEMKASGHGANVIAYSAAISALSKGQMWEKALELFREIERSGNTPSIVTYNATMTALEKGLQWERALDLFDEMKAKQLPITVVSYGSAISACEKGLQYRQCLEYLDEMTELGIKKNVIIFGAAMSCMEKCCRADIAFQLMDRMKLEGVAPNVHIFNSAISACARCNLWSKGLELFQEMEKVGVAHDVVSFNAVLDAVSSQVPLGRRLFELGIEKGFYARVSRLGTHWLELDLHFLSLGGGEIALGWWFEECLVPYLVNTSKLAAVKSIDIVTGYGKTRMRGVRHGDDGMRKRVRAMLDFMGIGEIEQPNKGRIHIDKEALIREVEKNGGKIVFDYDGYKKFKDENTTANHTPDVIQNVRPRYLGPLPTHVTSTDRRPFANRFDDYDHRGAAEVLRRDEDSIRAAMSQPNDDSNRGIQRPAGDRFTQQGEFNEGYKRRGQFDGRSRRESNLMIERKEYRDNSRLDHINHHSSGKSEFPENDESIAKNWHNETTPNVFRVGSRDERQGGLRESFLERPERVSIPREYPSNEQKFKKLTDNNRGQFSQDHRERISSTGSPPDTHSRLLSRGRWEAPRSKNDGKHEFDGHRTNERVDGKPTFQRYHADNRNRGQLPSDFSRVSHVPSERSHRSHFDKTTRYQPPNSFQNEDETKSSSLRDSWNDYDQHENGRGWGRNHDGSDDLIERTNCNSARQDFSGWNNTNKESIAARRDSQVHSNVGAAHQYGGFGNNSTIVNSSSARFHGHDRNNDSDYRSSHDSRGHQSYPHGHRADGAGVKRSFNGGEKPVAKKRGYDIDSSSRSSFNSSRGY